jgi:hypothetical protein
MNLDDESLAPPVPTDAPIVLGSKLNASSFEPMGNSVPPLPDYLQDSAPTDIIPGPGGDEPLPF